MKLKDLYENRFTYEEGDIVNTPFGPGTIVKDLGATNVDHFFSIVFGPDEQAKHGLQSKPYKFGSFQLSGIIKKGSAI